MYVYGKEHSFDQCSCMVYCCNLVGVKILTCEYGNIVSLYECGMYNCFVLHISQCGLHDFSYLWMWN